MSDTYDGYHNIQYLQLQDDRFTQSRNVCSSASSRMIIKTAEGMSISCSSVKEHEFPLASVPIKHRFQSFNSAS